MGKFGFGGGRGGRAFALPHAIKFQNPRRIFIYFAFIFSPLLLNAFRRNAILFFFFLNFLSR